MSCDSATPSSLACLCCTAARNGKQSFGVETPQLFVAVPQVNKFLRGSFWAASVRLENGRSTPSPPSNRPITHTLTQCITHKGFPPPSSDSGCRVLWHANADTLSLSTHTHTKKKMELSRVKSSPPAEERCSEKVTSNTGIIVQMAAGFSLTN